MARTGRVNHTHQYYRRVETGLWHCSGIEGCTHYIPKNMPSPIGRHSICWGCTKPFMLTPINTEEDKPRCDACSDQLDNIGDFLASKGLGDKQEDIAVRIYRESRERAMSEVNSVESEVVHAPDCDIYIGEECSCR